MSDLISKEAAIAWLRKAPHRYEKHGGQTLSYIQCAEMEAALRALPPAREAAPAVTPLARESADMPYRIFTDSSRVWLDDDDGGSLFAYVREGAPAGDVGKPISGEPVVQDHTTQAAHPVKVNVMPLLHAWDQWEGDIILNGDWTHETVRLTQAQHDRMIELQTERNRILAAREGGGA